MDMGEVDQDRIGTPAMGVKILKSAKDVGNADQVDVVDLQAAAELMNEVARRAAEYACEMSRGEAKKSGKSTLIKWIVELVVIFAGILWGISLLFAERPTEEKVEKMINSTHIQHPDSRAAIERHELELQQQKLQLNTIESGVKQIDKTLTKIEEKLKID